MVDRPRVGLEVGDPAPPFEGPAQNGRHIAAASLAGRPFILYFFPRAGSPGCSTEARGFAERYGEWKAAGYEVVGVSVDPPSAQARFAERCSIPFPLLADEQGTITRRYGVLGWLGLARRVTFFVSGTGIIEEIVWSALPGPHLRRAAERLREATGGRGRRPPETV